LSFFIFQRLISSLASKLRLERLRMRAALALLQLLRPLVVKLARIMQRFDGYGALGAALV